MSLASVQAPDCGPRRTHRQRFVSTAGLSRTCVYDRSFFEGLLLQLRAAGLVDAVVLLPHSSSPRPAEEFFEAAEDVEALLLVARSPRSGDTVKFLIVEGSDEVTFQDKTFEGKVPAGTAQLHVESGNPIRAFGLKGYFKELCRGQSVIAYAVIGLVTLAAIVFLTLEAIVLIFGRRLLIASEQHMTIAWDVVLTVISSAIVYRSYMHPNGLVLGQRHGARHLWRLLSRPRIKGHPLVTLLFGIISAVIGALLSTYLRHTP